MPGMKFFSIFSLILASLLLQKSFEVSFNVYFDEIISEATKLPQIHVTAEVAKISAKKTNYKSFFVLPYRFILSQKNSGHAENICGHLTNFSKPFFEKLSRAPPVA